MTYKYKLSANWISKISEMQEFANGGTQISVRLINDAVYHQILVSNSTWIIAMRGFKVLPFDLNDVEEIFQTEDDKNPTKRNEWDYFED